MNSEKISFMVTGILLFTIGLSGCTYVLEENIKLTVIEASYKPKIGFDNGLAVKLKIENNKDTAIYGYLSLILEDGTSAIDMGNMDIYIQIPANDHVIRESWFPIEGNKKPKAISFTDINEGKSYSVGLHI